MENLVLLFSDHLLLAIIFSIIINIVVAILGLIPSFFVTVFNIMLFGYQVGFLISVIGESAGALISFLIYRSGFKEISKNLVEKNSKIKAIINAEPREAFKLILAFRIFPYVPSGLVTYAAAIGKIEVIPFTIASTVGKIPALIIEVIVSGVVIGVSSKLPLKLIITIVSIVLLTFIIKGILKGKDE